LFPVLLLIFAAPQSRYFKLSCSSLPVGFLMICWPACAFLHFASCPGRLLRHLQLRPLSFSHVVSLTSGLARRPLATFPISALLLCAFFFRRWSPCRHFLLSAGFFDSSSGNAFGRRIFKFRSALSRFKLLFSFRIPSISAARHSQPFRFPSAPSRQLLLHPGLTNARFPLGANFRP